MSMMDSLTFRHRHHASPADTTSTCEAVLAAWCAANCPLAQTHGEMLARLDTNELLEPPKWRCYALTALTHDCRSYATSTDYCTRDDELRNVLRECIANDPQPAASVRRKCGKSLNGPPPPGLQDDMGDYLAAHRTGYPPSPSPTEPPAAPPPPEEQEERRLEEEPSALPEDEPELDEQPPPPLEEETMQERDGPELSDEPAHSPPEDEPEEQRRLEGQPATPAVDLETALDDEPTHNDHGAEESNDEREL